MRESFTRFEDIFSMKGNKRAKNRIKEIIWLMMIFFLKLKSLNIFFPYDPIEYNGFFKAFQLGWRELFDLDVLFDMYFF